MLGRQQKRRTEIRGSHDSWQGTRFIVLTKPSSVPELGKLNSNLYYKSGHVQSHIPQFIIEVVKLSTPPLPLTFRTVLIVVIKNMQHWPGGVEALRRQLKRQTDAASTGTAKDQVYWIGTIGPHWLYGQKIDDGGGP